MKKRGREGPFLLACLSGCYGRGDGVLECRVRRWKRGSSGCEVRATWILMYRGSGMRGRGSGSAELKARGAAGFKGDDEGVPVNELADWRRDMHASSCRVW